MNVILETRHAHYIRYLRFYYIPTLINYHVYIHDVVYQKQIYLNLTSGLFFAFWVFFSMTLITDVVDNKWAPLHIELSMSYFFIV